MSFFSSKFLSFFSNFPCVSLPDDIIWFEPPTVCRWETVAETEISERIENKSSANGKESTKRLIKMVSRQNKPIDVTITDFNLLKIPPKIDINFIIKDIIVPRIPDGYTITLSEPPQSRPDGLALFYSDSPPPNVRRNCIQIESTKDFLIPTNSPRPLHPKRTLKFNVKIIECNRSETNQKNEHQQYLLSQLLQDLDDLYDKQQPEIIKKMEEMSDILSMSLPDEPDSDRQEIESNADDMLLFKTEEFPWMINKKVETIAEFNEPTDDGGSENESADSDDDDE